MATDTFDYIVVWIIYTSYTDHFTPHYTAFEHSSACLSVVFELLSDFIPFTILWHTGWILDKNVNMNKNNSYPTTILESTLTQIYVFLVLYWTKLLNRQLTQHIFQYSSFIIKLFDMIFNIVYLGTCIRRLNITKFDSIRMFIYA